MNFRVALSYLFFIPVLALSGCIGGNAPLHYYMLHADSPAGSDIKPLSSAQGTVVGLGPIHIPEYLNRPQIVVGVTENQYRLDDQHRWAERLDQTISRTLLQSLSSQLGAVRIVRFPWSQRQNIDYQTRIDILQL